MAKNIRRKSSNRKKSIIIMIVSIVAVVALGVVLGIIAKINIDRQNANKNPGNSNPSTPTTPTTPGGSDTPGSGDDTPGTGGETPETPVDPDIPGVPDEPGTGGGETPDEPGTGGNEDPDEPGTGGNEDPDDPGTGGEDPDEPEIPDTPVVPVKALTVDITDAGLTNNFTSNGSSAVATITNNSAEVDGEILSLTNTLDLAKMKAGDAVSFEYEVENKMDNEYNYRLSILASGDNDLISKLIVEVKDAEAEQILYGATNMVAQLGNVSVSQTKTLKVTVKVKTGETVSVDDIAKLQFVLNGVQVATGTNASDDVYNVGYKEVATKAELATALTNVGTTGALAADVNILITNEAIANESANTIELDKDLNVNSSLSIMAPIGTTITITMDEGTAIKVGKGESLTLTNVVFTGNILTEDDSLDPITTSTSSNIANVVLDNVTVLGNAKVADKKEGGFNYYTFAKDESNPSAIQIETDSMLHVVGDVYVKGAWRASAIGVAEDVKVTITGDNLTAIGNNGYEDITDAAYRYVTKVINTADGENRINNATGYPTGDYAGTKFYDRLTDLWTKDTNPEAFAYFYNGSGYGADPTNIYNGVGGSGIGAISGTYTGEIVIDGVKNLVAHGYGVHAFGIGGATKAPMTINNTHIVSARGGYAMNEVALTNADSSSEHRYASSAPEGGAAIGVARRDKVRQVVNISNVTIDEIYGGSKAAAIGSMYWSDVDVNIVNSKINNAYGGISAAAIGTSRGDQGMNMGSVINIEDSEIDAIGGRFAAAIGSGYSSSPSVAADPEVMAAGFQYYSNGSMEINIEGTSKITGMGGQSASTIGTGYNQAGLKLHIDPTVDLTGIQQHAITTDEWHSGANYYFLESQLIGFGVVDPNRAAHFGTIGLVDGQVVSNLDMVTFADGVKPEAVQFDADTNTLTWNVVYNKISSLDPADTKVQQNNQEAYGYKIVVKNADGSVFKTLKMTSSMLSSRENRSFTDLNGGEGSANSGVYTYAFSNGELPAGEFSIEICAYTYNYVLTNDANGINISLYKADGSLNIITSDTSVVSGLTPATLTAQETTCEYTMEIIGGHPHYYLSWQAVENAIRYEITFTNNWGGQEVVVINNTITNIEFNNIMGSRLAENLEMTVKAYLA